MPQTTETMHSGACAPQLERENPHATTREKPVHRSEEPGYRNERSRVLQLRPNVAKKKKKKKQASPSVYSIPMSGTTK